MIAGLRGTVFGRESDSILVDVGGVIYRVGTSTTTLAESGDQDSPILLFTKLVVREDQLALYGFMSEEELTLFELVTGVTGIGPRIGCAVLSTFTSEVLHQALESEDINLLSTVPGIGRKTAARMIVELRGKLPALDADLASMSQASPIEREAAQALQALGYSTVEAHTALAGLPKDAAMTVEERVVAALKSLGG
jgi:Holliday junction DNA helicase RuvA